MNCPRCGNTDLWRDSADVGIGTIYGPYGCPCGWSEWESYDLTDGPKRDEHGYRLDQWGGLTPSAEDAS